MLTRAIPKTGEQLPAIGLGTWQTFDVGIGGRRAVEDVLRAHFTAGARVIDSSPMYGRAEEVTGDELTHVLMHVTARPFLATKVWTSGKAEGIAQMKRSLERLRTHTIDLMQVHNLVDVETHLPVLREWKAAGTIRYIGVTHYQRNQFDRIEQLMRTEQLDFIQIPYSIVDRVAEQRLLPLALDTGTAVLVMTPFESGGLFRQLQGKALPAWASDFDCTSWAQFFLKFLLGHPAVTCPIPATANLSHAEDNLRAGEGRLPDAKQREQMAKLFMQ